MMRAFRMFDKHTKFFLILASLAFLSCSKQKDTIPAKIYHSTTSYFNWYYNANQMFKESVNQLETKYKFPELGFIEVIYYGSERDAESMKASMGDIIKKNDAVIFKHPNGNYIDECRLLNGKCWFYQQEYTAAIQNFEFVIDKFPDSKVLADAYLYLAKTYYRMDNKIMANDILDKFLINNDTLEISDETYGELGLFRTRLAIEEEEFEKATDLLLRHLEFIKGYDRQTKANFLMGQLFALQNKYQESKYKFEEVAKMSRNYDLTFSAKLAIARLYVEMEKNDVGSGEDVYRYLTRLLKDEKNEEYRDQIYYEFAMIALGRGKKREAVDYLKKSVSVNVNNQRQRALSYFKIGQINFYDFNDYPVAQAYYDSAAQSIRPEDPEHDEIKNLAKTLAEYIGYLETIQYQDSLLRLSSMSEDELNRIIERLMEEEERRKEEEAAALLEDGGFGSDDPFFTQQNESQRRNNQNNSGQWYFDNPGTVEQGKQEFRSRWGNRNNEDHWRRSNKAQTQVQGKNGDINSQAATAQADAPNGVDSALVEKYGDKAKYYKDIPKTDEEKAIANKKIEDAYYGLGQLYYQQLEEADSAVEVFETLLERFPDTEYYLQARYALYKLYREELRIQAYRAHMNYILENHPNTVYAYLIQGKDPNELKRDEEDFYFAYDGLQQTYEKKEYESSVGFGEYLLSLEKFQDLDGIDMAKVKYIRGMAYGFLGAKDSLFNILSRVIEEFPEHAVTPMAQKTLGYMNNGIPEDTGVPGVGALSGKSEEELLADPNNPAYEGFTKQIKTKEKVFVIFYVDKKNIAKEALKTQISNFNNEKFGDFGLRTFVFLYKQTHWLPYIASFKSLEDAENYLADFRERPIYGNLIQPEDKIMFMSHSNFKVAYGQKRMKDYLNYYKYILGKDL